MTGTEELDLESIWNETDDEGNVLQSESDTTLDEPDAVEDEPGELDSSEGDEEPDEVADEEVDDESEAQPNEIDYKALWQKEKQRAESAAGRLRAETDRIAREREEMAGRVPPAPIPPSEEDLFLQKFKEEYSEDVIRAIDIITERKAAQVANSYIQTRVAPIENTTMNMVEQAHFSAIEAAHPDVYEIDTAPEFNAWIETRPAHVRGAYEYVRERGTPAEVISMLNEYKATTRRQPTSAPPAKEKVQAAMGVQRRRGTAQTQAEPSITDEKALWDSIPD